MKICFIAWERFGVGGVSRVLTRVMNALAREHEISVYCLRQPPLENAYGLNLDRIRFFHHEMSLYEKIRRSVMDRLVTRTPLFSSAAGARAYALLRYTRAFKKRLANHINSQRYDAVIFGSGFEDSLLLALVQPRLSPGTRTISWSHAAYEDYFGFKGPHFARYFRHALQRFYRRFDQIIVLSDHDRENFEKRHWLKTRRIYNPASFTAAEHSALTSKTFVFAGSLSSHKGADLALEAFEEFSRRNGEWNLHVYGEGPLRPWMEGFIREHGLQSRVRLHGSHGAMEREYPKHAVLLFPSRCEGFGLVQIEAMSCGLPVLAADIPICRELIRDSGTGRLFPAGDSHALCAAMLTMAAEDLAPYARKAREQEPRFTLERIIREWNEILRGENS